MDIVSQLPISINNSFKQPPGKRQLQRKRQTLSATISTAKAGQGFIVTVALYAGRTHIAADLLRVKDCPNAERAWLAGYYRIQSLADDYPFDTQLYIENSQDKGGMQ